MYAKMGRVHIEKDEEVDREEICCCARSINVELSKWAICLVGRGANLSPQKEK